MKFSKFALSVLAASTMVGSAAFAAVPDCWDKPGVVADGEFLVDIDVSQISKGDLVDVLDKVSARNISPAGYPLVIPPGNNIPGLISVNVKAVDYDTKKLSRPELKKAVNEQLEPISEIKGVTIECNGIVYPAGN